MLADDLRGLLGVEAGDGWLRFMDTVVDRLPFLAKPGRPKRSEIENSEVGRSGFQSWREMIEADPAAGGLGWNWNTWESYRRAYKLVLQHPWLRDVPEITPSKINRAPSPFPESAEAWSQSQADRRAAAADRHAEALAATRRDLNAAKSDLSAAESKIAELEQELAEARGQVSSLQTDLQTAQRAHQASERELSRIRSLPWWRRIFSLR